MTDPVARRVLDWFDVHGRKDLPWQHPRTPYNVWVSEVMLQQTQVRTAIPYYQAFVRRFPDVQALAEASVDDVLHLWSGLGYYSRGQNLHRTARQLVQSFAGEFPADVATLQTLPGVGRSTAGAILAMGFGKRAPILDGNVKRVLARHHRIEGYPGDSRVQKVLWEIADNHTPGERVADYTQAIMDLGATVCTRRNPDCGCCPVNVGCLAFRDDLVHTLPTAKPRKPLPARDRRFWLIQRDDGSCLLERRPPGGLWGGLWSPPERDKDSSIEHLTAEFGLDLRISPTPAPPPFTHAFTHLQMNVIPMRACAGKHTSVADRDDLIWYRPGLNQSIGLSAVASRLLNHLFRSQP